MRRKTIFTVFLICVFVLSSLNVSAASKPSSVKITAPKSSYAMNVNTTKTFTAKTSPKEAVKNVKWKNSAKSVISLKIKNKANGTVTVKALKPGTSYIQAYVGSKVSSKIKITVKAPIKSISVKASKTTLSIGETTKATVAYHPSDTTDSKKVTWISSNSNIAKVSANGTITAVKAGNAIIKATTQSKKTATIKITVKNRTDLPMSADVNNYYEKVDIHFAEQVGHKLANNAQFFDHKSGFRTAGSDAEHAMASELEKVFINDVGLKPENVEKVEVKLDKWQFNGAYLKMDYTTGEGEKRITNRDIISYASNGTEGDLKGDMVYVGLGTKKQYEDIKKAKGDENFFKDKIVLAEIDQYNLWWITTHYIEAYEQGAAAILFYETGNGYGAYKDDATVVQDICAPDYIPCAAISRKSGLELKSAIEKDVDGKCQSILNIDNTVGNTQSDKAYNVVAKIPGTGNTGQQIIFSAHYDKYFIGWEDDAIAIGTIAAIAKSMVDSGYKPVNDIIFIGFAAEEWGQTASLADWGAGSWQQIQKAAPQWQGTTLAMINFELPGIDTGADYGIMRSTKELGNVGQQFLDSGLLDNAPKFYTAKTGSEPVTNKNYKITDGVQVLNDDTIFLTDSASFQMSGVPCIVPREESRSGWTTDFYHTKYDTYNSDGINATKYEPKLIEFDIAMYGALGQYIDKTPAHTLDLNDRLSQLEADLNQGTMDALGSDIAKADQYKAAIKRLKAANEVYLTTAEKINKKYVDAYQSGASEVVLQGILDEGKTLNKKMLNSFVLLQDTVVGVNSAYDGTRIKHTGVQDNIANLKIAISNLEKPDSIEAVNTAMVALRKLPSASYAYRFGKIAYTDMINMTNGTGTDHKGRNIPIENWGYNNLIPAPTSSSGAKAYWEASQQIMSKADYDPAARTVGNTCSLKAEDYASAVKVLKEALTDMQMKFDTYFSDEVKGLSKMVETLDQ